MELTYVFDIHGVSVHLPDGFRRGARHEVRNRPLSVERPFQRVFGEKKPSLRFRDVSLGNHIHVFGARGGLVDSAALFRHGGNRGKTDTSPSPTGWVFWWGPPLLSGVSFFYGGGCPTDGFSRRAGSTISSRWQDSRRSSGWGFITCFSDISTSFTLWRHGFGESSSFRPMRS